MGLTPAPPPPITYDMLKYLGHPPIELLREAARHDKLTAERCTASRKGDIVKHNCENCGAPLPLNLKCEYCDTQYRRANV